MSGRIIPLSKYGPIAALVKAVTRGILPAYLTMAGQNQNLSLHMCVLSQMLTLITHSLVYA